MEQTSQHSPTDEANGAERARGTVARNPTVVAVSKVSTVLDNLDEETRGKVVRFIAEEYSTYLD